MDNTILDFRGFVINKDNIYDEDYYTNAYELKHIVVNKCCNLIKSLDNLHKIKIISFSDC